MSEEIWKDVPEYEGIYQVSNMGRVKSLKRRVWNGQGYRIVKERILRAGTKKDGYLSVVLCKKGKKNSFGVHILVAMAFLDHIPFGHHLVVDHIKEGNKQDNRLENLQIITQRDNVEKAKGKFSSKHKGISWNKRKQKWKATYYCSITKKQNFIGYYDTEEQAYFARESWISDYREYRERIESSWF